MNDRNIPRDFGDVSNVYMIQISIATMQAMTKNITVFNDIILLLEVLFMWVLPESKKNEIANAIQSVSRFKLSFSGNQN